MIFRIDKDKKLHYVDDENEELYRDNPNYIILDDLPDATYPLYMLDDTSNVVPDDERIFEKAKLLKLKEINQIRNEILNSGFKYTQPSTSSVYMIDSHKDAQVNIIGIYLAALADSTFQTYFITQDNQEILLTNDDIKSLFLQGAQWKQTIIFKARQLKNQVLNATTLDEVFSISWDTTKASTTS